MSNTETPFHRGDGRPRLLDLFCCQGGAGTGYAQVGFDVTGVDIAPQRRNPHFFIQADALEFLSEQGHKFDVIHASPPCQRYSATQRIRGNDHPDLIGPTRDLLLELGVPYVIENVMDARGDLRDPVMLCGAMFPELRVYRHRLFETNWPLTVPLHPQHVVSQVKMGRPPMQGEFIQCVGNFSNVDYGRDAMGMPWATREGLREAIPPASRATSADGCSSTSTTVRSSRMPPEPVPSRSARACEAPGCPRTAVYIARGVDTVDNTDFEDAVCQSCADYLTECSALLNAPLKLTRLERV